MLVRIIVNSASINALGDEELNLHFNWKFVLVLNINFDSKQNAIVFYEVFISIFFLVFIVS